jgi:DNA-binding response OmpR family regulator
MKILVVDDEKLIRDVIREYAYNENYEVIEAEDGMDAIEKVKENSNIDMIIMDIMMPKLDGYRTSKEIKKIADIPIIMLSAREEEYDKLTGFDIGIDDYITKPFSPKELMARIKAVSKRTMGDIDKFIYEDLEIDYKAHTVKIENEEIKLTPKEYELLCYFVKNQNIALSREQLLSKLWGYDFFGDDRTIDTHIKMLRGNLGKYRDLIVTVRGMGYKFETKES